MSKLAIPRDELLDTIETLSQSAFLTEGRFVRDLETEVLRWSGMEAIAVSSAGTGLFTILKCLGLPEGSEVVVSANTFFATGGMAKEAGLTVVLADCSKEDFCLTPETILPKITPRTKAVILTHVGGGLASRYYDIFKLCEAKGLLLIEDAAHALGVGQRVGPPVAGEFGTAAVFSLYPTKAIPAGEGGLIVTRDKSLAADMRRYRNYGKWGDNGVVRYTGQGFNFRMDEWTAAVSLLQFQRRLEIIENRQRQADFLRKIVEPMVSWENDATNWYKYIVPASFEAERKSGQVYASTDQLDVAMALGGVYENAKWVAENHICLPLELGLYDNMSKDEALLFLRGLR